MTPKNSEPKNTDAALYNARDRVIAAMPNIIDKIISEAKEKGSVPHAKFLLDFASCGPGDAPVPGDEESLAALLLEELKEGPII